ncbi:hypothetical protein B0H34DRAFT_685699 [Crassisporium funariophilum]|nr:hypothetical protein B0H34DRAFT_685699 [Crassisporium funariophilum]
MSAMHSTPATRQMQILLWVSVALSCCAFAFSLSFLASLSLYMCPGVFALSMAHNITLLITTARERKLHAASGFATSVKLPSTSTKAAVICSWILVVLWTAVFGMVLSMAAIITGGGEFKHDPILPVAYLEWIVELAEVVVMVLIAVKCTREMRAVGSAASGHLDESKNNLKA